MPRSTLAGPCPTSARSGSTRTEPTRRSSSSRKRGNVAPFRQGRGKKGCVAQHFPMVDRAGHGGWLPWLEREFAWTEMTATRYINVAKSNKLLDRDVRLRDDRTSGHLPHLATTVAPGEKNSKKNSNQNKQAKLASATHVAPTPLDGAFWRGQRPRDAATDAWNPSDSSSFGASANLRRSSGCGFRTWRPRSVPA